jgi:histidine triad (HIT) family protein
MANSRMSIDCLFCRISSGTASARVIWSDKDHIAFLTPFPNARGFTVLASREHLSSDILELESGSLASLTSAAQVVARLLKRALGVGRIGLIAEGYGINHCHIKLVPLHGIDGTDWRQISSEPHERRFYSSYPGFIASHDGPPAEAADLEDTFKSILAAG